MTDNTELLPVSDEDCALAVRIFNKLGFPDTKGSCDETEVAQWLARHRLNTRTNQGHDALVEAMEIISTMADVLEGDCGCPPCVGSMAPAEDALGRARELQARLTNLPSPQVEGDKCESCGGPISPAKCEYTACHAPLKKPLRFVAEATPQAEAAPDDGLVAALHEQCTEVARDMAGHVADQIFDVLKRHGLMMRTEAMATAMMAHAAMQVLRQACDQCSRAAEEDCTAEVVKLFTDLCPPAILTALRARPSGDGEGE